MIPIYGPAKSPRLSGSNDPQAKLVNYPPELHSIDLNMDFHARSARAFAFATRNPDSPSGGPQIDDVFGEILSLRIIRFVQSLAAGKLVSNDDKSHSFKNQTVAAHLSPSKDHQSDGSDLLVPVKAASSGRFAVVIFGSLC
ncbi:hypothetical protein ACLOJK_016503 [Asimina triloba]